MYNYLVENQGVTFFLFLLLMLVFVVIFIKVMKSLGLEKIRPIVYKGFLLAENEFKKGDNKLKFEYVVHLARDSIPKPFKAFITEQTLRDIIQLWFELCKDLLDDGKLNNKEVKKEE